MESVAGGVIGSNAHASVRLVQDSHIVVRRLYKHDSCYIFQNADKRIFFLIPYEQDFTLIGTTDQDFKGDPTGIQASTREIDYPCRATSELLSTAQIAAVEAAMQDIAQQAMVPA